MELGQLAQIQSEYAHDHAHLRSITIADISLTSVFKAVIHESHNPRIKFIEIDAPGNLRPDGVSSFTFRHWLVCTS